uniref:Uncharacterized protein n=1 Tax=Oryza rufipogon TaxID=4529 RepID=A0A0E0NVL3_ORYRU
MWDLCCSCDPICKSQRVELIGIVTPNLLVSVQNWNRYHNRSASRTSSLSRSCHSGYTLSKNIVHGDTYNQKEAIRPRGGCVPYSSFQATKCGTTRRR